MVTVTRTHSLAYSCECHANGQTQLVHGARHDQTIYQDRKPTGDGARDRLKKRSTMPAQSGKSVEQRLGWHGMVAWLHGRERRTPSEARSLWGFVDRPLVGECTITDYFIRVYRGLLVCTVGMYSGREGYQLPLLCTLACSCMSRAGYHTGLHST